MKRTAPAAGLVALLGVAVGFAASSVSDAEGAADRCKRSDDAGYDPTTPCVEWQTPGSGEAVSGVLREDTCNIDVVYGRIQIRNIVFSVDGRSLNTRESKPYSCYWDTRNSPNGVHQLRASVSFDDDRVVVRDLSVDVQNLPEPTVVGGTTITTTTTTGGGSGGGGSGGGGAPPARIASTISHQWLVYRRHAVVTRLDVRDVPTGGIVSVRCRGGGCGFRSRRLRVSGAPRSVRLQRYFRGARLRPRAQVEIRVAKRGAIGKLVRYTVLRGKRLPRRTVACLSSGSGRRIRCP
jgi:hypothetical protein